jgi:hypothetical protein
MAAFEDRFVHVMAVHVGKEWAISWAAFVSTLWRVRLFACQTLEFVEAA